MIGQRLANFYLIRSLGAGGSGMVYEAQDTRLPRSVAIKVLKPSLAGDATALRRFRREAKLASLLNHPNICTILDVDSASNPPFIAMELLHGGSLKARLSAGPLDLNDIIAIGTQVATALAVAHDRGVLHRDVTPGNVFLTDSGLVKLLDFGLARYVRGNEGALGSEVTTSLDHVAGTAPYMAPELFTGHGVDDPRSDLYSLGAVLYEMATRSKPFEARTRPELIAAIVGERPVPVPALAPHHPVQLAGLIERLLAKQPHERHQHGRDVRAELEALHEHGRAPFRSPSPAAGPVTIAVLPFDVEGGADDVLSAMAEGLAEDVSSRLSAVSHLRVCPRTHASGLPSMAPADVGRLLDAHAVLTGSVGRTEGRLAARAAVVDVHGDLGPVPPLAIETPLTDVLAAQDEVARRIADHVAAGLGHRDDRGGTSDPDALNAFKRGQHYWQHRFSGGWLAAIDHFERAIERDPGFAAAHVSLSAVYEFLGSFCLMKPKLAYGVARESIHKALHLTQGLATAQLQLALIEFGGEWDWDASEAAFRRAIELDPSSARAHVCYSWLLIFLGRQAAAAEMASAGHALAPRSRFATCGRAQTLYFAGQYEAATALCDACLRDDPDYATARVIRGQCYELQGRLPEALADLEHAATTTARMPYFLGVLGHCYGISGYRAKALDIVRELDAVSRESYVPPQCYVFTYAGLGERSQALAYQEQAYADGASPLNYFAPYIRRLYALDPQHKSRLEQMRLAL